MPKTDAQRRAQNKYQAAHYTNISIKVTKEYAHAVKTAAAAINQAPAAIIRRAFDTLLQSQGINPATLAAADSGDATTATTTPAPGDNNTSAAPDPGAT